MSTIPESSITPAGADGRQLWCGRCRTDQHLIIESIESHVPAGHHLVEVCYSCAECDSFYAHTATVEQVAAVLNRPGISHGVLKFGGEYIHCGEPMQVTGNEWRSIQETMTTDGTDRDRALEVYLRTRVLHCGCGFQMEIPD